MNYKINTKKNVCKNYKKNIKNQKVYQDQEVENLKKLTNKLKNMIII